LWEEKITKDRLKEVTAGLEKSAVSKDITMADIVETTVISVKNHRQ